MKKYFKVTLDNGKVFDVTASDYHTDKHGNLIFTDSNGTITRIVTNWFTVQLMREV